jgi:RND family efflux transporter MFP subunit
MTAPGPNRRWMITALVAAVTLLVLWYGLVYLLRPVALVATVVSGRAIHAVPGSVEVKAEYVMELKSEVGGRIVASELDPGKKVFNGDVLVQIDPGDINLEIERIKDEITAAKRKVELGSTMRADVLNMRDTVANLERQTKTGAYPESELEKQRRLLQQLEQRMELDEVNMKLALDNNENQLRTKQREKEKMTIISPTDGVIASVNLNARKGDLIGRDTPIATLISSTRTIEAKVSEENFAGIMVGQKASIRFLGYGAQLYNASVVKVLPTANAETQRYIVHLTVDIPVEKLVPGLTGEVSIVLGEREAAAIIPRRALRGNEVFVVNGNKVELRKVRLGYQGLNQAEVLEGLRKDERVIVEELDRFQAGDRVRVKQVE